RFFPAQQAPLEVMRAAVTRGLRAWGARAAAPAVGMHPLPRPAVVPQPSPPRLRRLPSPLASGLPAVVRALRPARAAVRALPVVRPVARRLQHGSLGGMAGERGSGRHPRAEVPRPATRRRRARGGGGAHPDPGARTGVARPRAARPETAARARLQPERAPGPRAGAALAAAR